MVAGIFQGGSCISSRVCTIPSIGELSVPDSFSSPEHLLRDVDELLARHRQEIASACEKQFDEIRAICVTSGKREFFSSALRPLLAWGASLCAILLIAFAVHSYSLAIHRVPFANTHKRLRTAPKVSAAVRNTPPHRWPLARKGVISSPFGRRLDPFFHRDWEMHYGVDIAAPLGTRVLAAGSGRILKMRYSRTAGNHLVIDHGHGLKSEYMHLLRFAPHLTPGAYVREGQLIAYVGEGGRTTGPHLHFEIVKEGHPVDPMPYLRHEKSRAETVQR
ncbi:M23 family metallopeptidase [Candidatus Parcubacteria bacterium]|nr:MAG: M23 family metallopeptidase [Candidatus Parcubacteria bacterium]